MHVLPSALVHAIVLALGNDANVPGSDEVHGALATTVAFERYAREATKAAQFGHSSNEPVLRTLDVHLEINVGVRWKAQQP